MPRIAKVDVSHLETQHFHAMFFDPYGNLLPNQDALAAKWTPIVRKTITSRMSNVIVNDVGASQYYLGDTIVEQALPGYPDLVSEHTEWERHSNKPFKKRVRNGEVVLAPYERGTITVRSTPGISLGSYFGQQAGRHVDGSVMVEFCGWNRVDYWGPSQGPAYRPPGETSVYVINIYGIQPVYNLYYDYQPIPPLELYAKDVYAKVKTSRSVDVGLVTETLARANKRLLDVLTALAETPESLRSILQLIQQVANITKGVKKRQFSLTQSFKDRKEFLTRKRNEDLHQLDVLRSELQGQVSARSISRRVAKKRERQLERDQRRTISSFVKAQRKAELELGDALSHVWMNYRYNIMPMVYTAIDITEAVTKNPEFLTERNGSKPSVEIDLGIPNLPAVPVDRVFSVFIRDKAKADVGPFSLTSKVMSANILTTAWELIPLSFVVDWFVNVGDTIAAFSGGSTADRNSTISFKDLIEYNESLDTGQRLIINGRIYNCQVTGSLLQYACLTFEPDVNPHRQLDSIALFWNAIRGDLKRSIR